MVSRTVTTKEELQKANDDKVDEKTRKLKYVALAILAGLGGAIAVTTASAATIPVIGGVGITASSSAVLAINTSTELNAVAVIIAVSIGITLLTHVFKEYDEVEVGCGAAWLKLKRKDAVEKENE